ncbi:hypothetical protein F4810DRAFT_503211 [Camillea tinctor]|nr:hypothetical protein F4810DRAFT_503211 [Camillea tinctor]
MAPSGSPSPRDAHPPENMAENNSRSEEFDDDIGNSLEAHFARSPFHDSSHEPDFDTLSRNPTESMTRRIRHLMTKISKIDGKTPEPLPPEWVKEIQDIIDMDMDMNILFCIANLQGNFDEFPGNQQARLRLTRMVLQTKPSLIFAPADSSEQTPLHLAIENKDVKLAFCMMDSVDRASLQNAIKAKNKQDEVCLHIALTQSQYSIADKLIKKMLSEHMMLVRKRLVPSPEKVTRRCLTRSAQIPLSIWKLAGQRNIVKISKVIRKP